MARRLRIHIPFAFYHVTLRGNHRQDIFYEPRHREWLNDIVAEVIRRFGARIHAYCWMTNHLHMLAQVGEIPLGEVIRHIAGPYARKVQAHIQTTGHLFQKRYDARLVDADAYLLELIRYIHLNPVRAELVKTPTDYSWSSHRVYLGISKQEWVTTDYGLAMFHQQRGHAIAAYREFVEHACSDLTSPLLASSSTDVRVLGSDEFVRKAIGGTTQPRSTRKLDDVIEEVSRELSVSIAQLESKSAYREVVRARALIAHRCVRNGVASLAAVARRFNRDESTLRESIKRYCR